MKTGVEVHCWIVENMTVHQNLQAEQIAEWMDTSHLAAGQTKNIFSASEFCFAYF